MKKRLLFFKFVTFGFKKPWRELVWLIDDIKWLLRKVFISFDRMKRLRRKIDNATEEQKIQWVAKDMVKNLIDFGDYFTIIIDNAPHSSYPDQSLKAYLTLYKHSFEKEQKKKLVEELKKYHNMIIEEYVDETRVDGSYLEYEKSYKVYYKGRYNPEEEEEEDNDY